MSDIDEKKAWPSRRVVFRGRGDVTVEVFTEEGPGPNEILVEARASLISPGTEKACLTGRANWVTFPHQPGYSHAGVVRAVGAGVDAPEVGTRLYSQLPHTRFGRLTLATAEASDGQTGNFNTMDTAAAIPKSVIDDHAVFAGLSAVSLYGVRRARIVPGECVAVVGLGVVGQLAIQLARLTGAYPVIGVDPIESRRSLALRLGADDVIDPAATSWVKHTQETWGGTDVILESAGRASLLRECVQAAKVGGRVVIASSIYESAQLDLFPGLDSKDVSLIGCHQPNNPIVGNAVYPWCQRRDRELILNYLATGRLQVAPLISHRFEAQDAPEAYRVLQDTAVEKMGILLEWERDES